MSTPQLNSALPADAPDKPVALLMGLGLFGGGVASARWLARQGYRLLVTDQRSSTDLASSMEALSDLEIEWRLGEHRREDFERAQLLLKNPAVRFDHPLVQAAVSHGARVTSEIEIVLGNCPATTVGVTGSNGKTTVAHMVARMLDPLARGQGGRVWLGGNMGSPLIGNLADMRREDIVVLELSSFQLMDLDRSGLSPTHSIITNITPNHLDWHKDMAEYLRAKSAIFRHARPDGQAVLNGDDPLVAPLAARVPCQVASFSIAQPPRGAIVMEADTAVLIPSAQVLFAREDLRVPGEHNVANALAAAGMAALLGAETNDIAQALRCFGGVEHRLEFVDTIRDVRYYNDSIATTPESTIAAIRSFSEPIWLLLGGSDKGLAFDLLARAIGDSPHVRTVFVTGDTGPKIAEAIHGYCRAHPDPSRFLRIEAVAEFDECVKRAVRSAAPGSVFLMSPACASFYEFSPGQRFRNFEQRGEHFKQLIKTLAREKGSDGA